MFFLLGVILLIAFILIVYFYLKWKIKNIFGNISIRDIVNTANELAEDTPKSVGSMDSIYLSNLQKDFPTLNINEMKKIAEKDLYTYFQAIEEKNKNLIECDTVRKKVEIKIKELKGESIFYSKFKIHRMVLNKYEKKNAIATITIAISLEYQLKKKENISRVQDRYRLEYIYVIDSSKVKGKKKVLGIHCPNCGSPITSLGKKKCSYCNSLTVDMVKRVWTLNSIEKY